MTKAELWFHSVERQLSILKNDFFCHIVLNIGAIYVHSLWNLKYHRDLEFLPEFEVKRRRSRQKVEKRSSPEIGRNAATKSDR